MNIASLIRHGIDIFRLSLIGIFDSKNYKISNKDIGFFPSIVHWVIFGRYEEGRIESLSIEFRWIGEKYLNREISFLNIMNIKRHLKSETINHEIAKLFNLNYSDYLFLKYISLHKYTEANRILKSCSDITYLEGAFYLARKKITYDELPNVLERFENISFVDIRKNRLLLDISQTLGLKGEKYIDQLVSIMKDPSSNTEAQVFSARLPVVCADTMGNFSSSSTFSKTLKALPIVNQYSSKRNSDFINKIAGFESIINCSTYNNIAISNPHCIYGNSLSNCKIKPLKYYKGKAVKFRVLMPEYWLESKHSDSVIAKVLKIHKQMIHSLLAKKIAIVPVFASPLYDISNENNFGLPTLSYHTISDKKAKDNRFLHYKESYLPGYFSCDREGYSGWSSLVKKKITDKNFTIDVIRNHKEELYKEFIAGNKSKYMQIDKNLEILPDNYIFAALQVPDDSVEKLAYLDRYKWINILCKFGNDNNIPIVIKVHPKDNSLQTKKWITNLSKCKGIFISDANIHNLISKSIGVITCNSGVGFEALVHHKLVITCGLSDYHSMTYLVKDEDSLIKSLQNIILEKMPVSRKAINEFLFFYCKSYCIRNIETSGGAYNNFIEEFVL